MLRNYHGLRFLKVVYAKTQVDGKVELVPLELYADGSLKPGNTK